MACSHASSAACQLPKSFATSSERSSGAVKAIGSRFSPKKRYSGRPAAREGGRQLGARCTSLRGERASKSGWDFKGRLSPTPLVPNRDLGARLNLTRVSWRPRLHAARHDEEHCGPGHHDQHARREEEEEQHGVFVPPITEHC